MTPIDILQTLEACPVCKLPLFESRPNSLYCPTYHFTATKATGEFIFNVGGRDISFLPSMKDTPISGDDYSLAFHTLKKTGIDGSGLPAALGVFYITATIAGRMLEDPNLIEKYLHFE
jgi:hypothetical protein